MLVILVPKYLTLHLQYKINCTYSISRADTNLAQVRHGVLELQITL